MPVGPLGTAPRRFSSTLRCASDTTSNGEMVLRSKSMSAICGRLSKILLHTYWCINAGVV